MEWPDPHGHDQCGRDSDYQLYTFDVVGVAGYSTLQFFGYNLPDANRLDDISLTVATGAPPVTPPIVGNDSSNSLTGTSGDDTILGSRRQGHTERRRR